MAALALLIFAAIAWPLVANYRRPAQISFAVKDIYAQSAKVEDAFAVSDMSRDFVVFEGPCGDGGCNGGILSQQYPIDVKAYIPNLKNYDGQSTTIIWLYKTKPVKVTRHNDLFGNDTVTISGRLTKERKVFYALVPRNIVAPSLEWVYVETE